MPENKIAVLGVKLFSKNIQCAVEILLREIKTSSKQNRCISATSAHGLVFAQKDKGFFRILSSFYMNLPDGQPLVWVGHLKGAKEMRRCYGPNFFKEMMIATAESPVKHYFCGGKEGVPEKLKDAVEKKFGNMNVCGTYSPPFREMTDDEMKQLAEQVNNANADILWIGLSTPKQEKFAARLAAFTNVHFIITVGAAFDFHTDNLRQAPKFLQKIGLEWFFRLAVEPRRLWRRYAVIVPLFLYFNIKDFLRIKKGS